MSVWSTLDMRRRFIVIGATIAMFAAVLGLSRMASQPTMALLYSGLDPAAAGEVVAALEQQAVNYDVRAGAIFVEAARRDALRLTLAAEGLPASNGQGYEILDSLTGFGTTSQMFDAAYWRAKEGELARTIVANPQIQGARVHISNPSSNPFQRDLKATASVTVMTNAGSIGATQAKALKYLVASAVAGLLPEDVSVIDGRGGLIMSGDDPQINAGSGVDVHAKLFRRAVLKMKREQIAAFFIQCMGAAVCLNGHITFEKHEGLKMGMAGRVAVIDRNKVFGRMFYDARIALNGLSQNTAFLSLGQSANGCRRQVFRSVV